MLTPAAFIRQRDEISCSAACLATVAALYDVSKDYDFFRDRLPPCPEIGTMCLPLAALAAQHLPVTGQGEGIYKGGPAVACIYDVDEAHYVVFLAEKDGRVLYYCPYDHTIEEKALDEIDWRSETEPFQKWCVTLAPHPDLTWEAVREIAGQL